MELPIVDNAPLYLQLSNLPELKSLCDYCYLDDNGDISKTYQNSSWLNLFNFVAYNMSLRQSSFNQKMEDLKIFAFINDTNTNNISFDTIFIPVVYSQIIINFLNGIIEILNKEEFYNNESYYNGIIDLFELIYELEKKFAHNSACESKQTISTLKNIFIEKSSKYGKKFLGIYNFYLRILNHNKANNNNVSPMTLDIPSNNKPILLKNDKALNLTESDTKINPDLPELKQVCSASKNENSISTINDSQDSQIVLINKKKTNKCLIALISEALNQHKLEEKFLEIDFYEDSQFKLQRIGSFTFGLNSQKSKMDFIISPKNYTEEITLDTIVSWITDKSINNNRFSSDEPINKFAQDNKIKLKFTSKEGTFDAVLHFMNEKYIKCNELFQKMFPRRSILSQIYIFTKPLLKIHDGVDLSFLILGFLHSKFYLFDTQKKEYKYKIGKMTSHNTYINEEDYCIYYDISKKKLKELSSSKIDAIIMKFMKYYYSLFKLTGNRTTTIEMEELAHCRYLFSMQNVFKSMKDTYGNNDYWNKVKTIRNSLQKSYFCSYQELVNYFNES